MKEKDNVETHLSNLSEEQIVLGIEGAFFPTWNDWYHELLKGLELSLK